VAGTAGRGAGVVKTSDVVTTGELVVVGALGGSVNPVMISSTASSLMVVLLATDFVVGTTVVGAPVVDEGMGAGVVVVVSTCWGGAARAPAASSKEVRRDLFILFLISLACQRSQGQLLHSASRVSGLL